jgi:hypothetical protein
LFHESLCSRQKRENSQDSHRVFADDHMTPLSL